MCERKKRFWNPAVAMAFDGEQMWWARGPEGQVVACPVTLSIADFSPGKNTPKPEQLKEERCMREGGVGNFDLAEAMVRRELRKGRSIWQIAPRVVVAAPRAEAHKRVLRDVIINAGARDLITIPKPMAAALGAGIMVDADRITAVVYLERDWTSLMVIRNSQIQFDWERAGAVDQLVEDVSAQARELRETTWDFQRLRENIKTHGLFDPVMRAGATRFLVGLRERFRYEAECLSQADQRDLRCAPLYLLGPYACIPGLRELLTELWQREVILPDAPERVVILGCRKVLGQLDAILKTF